MLIKIYDRNQGLDEQLNYCMVLGVHSFSHFLTEISNKRNSTILIKGKVKQVIQNILWNQYFSYTLLKDINKVIFAEAQHRNCFLKVGGKTYRLSDCLEWTNVNKIQQEIIKYPAFCIEGFMVDSSIKFVNIDIAEVKTKEYDIVFQYLSAMSNNSISFGSTNKCESDNYTSFSKTKIKNPHTKAGVAVKSLFEGNGQKQRSGSSIKYSTERKSKQSIQKPAKNDFNTKKQIYRPKKVGQNSSKQGHKQNMSNSLKQQHSNKPSSAVSIQYQMDALRKQDLTAVILHKKDEKIKQYRVMMQQKQKQYEQKISNLTKTHEQQVSAIKKQVQEVLSSYKKKNKQLKKQNQCLVEQNKNLTISNRKLEEKLQAMAEDMKVLKQSQQKLEKNNMEYGIKLQSIQTANMKLVDKINVQENNFKSQISEKDKTATEIKTKYERLLGTIKVATAEMDKENIC